MPASPDRAELLAMLTTLGDRSPDQVPESIDSMALAWLIHQVEERYDVLVDLDDAELARITSVTAAERILRERVFEAADD
jgi:acyl carrier protein